MASKFEMAFVAGVAVILVLILVGSAFGNTNSTPDATYDYELTESTGWIDEGTYSDYEVKPDEGKKFAIAHIKASSTTCTGLSSNPFNWNIVCNGTIHGSDWATYDHPKYQETMELLPGYSMEFWLVYQIPVDADVSSCKIQPDFRGTATVSHDPNLL